METENLNSNANKSSFLKWIGLIVLVILLVAAAFVGGQLFNRQANPQTAGPGGNLTFVGGGGEGSGGVAQSVELHVIPSEELPKTQPDAQGIFVRREDNSLFIGTGNLSIEIMTEPDTGPSAPSASYDGPVVEVVVSGETTVYKEITALNGPPPSGETEQEIQQEVAEGTIEEIGDTSHVIVWGRKVGDRIIADILVYSEPVIFVGPAAGP